MLGVLVERHGLAVVGQLGVDPIGEHIPLAPVDAVDKSFEAQSVIQSRRSADPGSRISGGYLLLRLLFGFWFLRHDRLLGEGRVEVDDLPRLRQ